MQWNDLRTILAIGRAGNLSAAARALEVNHSTVFRQLNAVEDRMGTRFFERLPHGYVATEAGEAVLRVAERIDTDVLELERTLVGRDRQLRGTLRLTAPEGISQALLGPCLAAFRKSHPGIRIDLEVTSSVAELSRREADVAVRVTKKPPDAAFGRRVCGFHSTVYASKGYLREHARRNLAEHRWLLFEVESDWMPAGLWRGRSTGRREVVFSTNDIMVLARAAKEGQGVAVLPCLLGDPERTLVRVVEPPDSLTRELWVITHPDLQHTARVRTLMRFLCDRLREHRDLIEGRSA